MTVASAGQLIRIRPAPRLEPPADDEPGRGWPPTPPEAPELPLDWSIRPEPGPAAAPGDPAPASEGLLAAHRYLSLCAEVLAGFRPRVHLRPLTSPGAYDEVMLQLARPRATGVGRGRGGPAGQHSGARLVRVVGGHVVLRHVRVCEPLDGVAEAAAVFGRGEFAWAAAARLERGGSGWLCTYLRML